MKVDKEMSHKLVSVCIPVFNRIDLVRRCVSAIREYTSYSPYEIVVVDDGSTKREVRRYLNSMADKVVTHGTNLGIAQSRNDAMEAAEGDYICQMDSDSVVTPHWLGRLVETLETGNGWDPEYYEMALVSPLFSHQVGYFLNQQDCVNRFGLIQVGILGMACTLYRRSLIDVIGSFDWQLHNLWSDMDFCKRLFKMGEKYKKARGRGPRMVIEPKVMAYHHGWVDPDTGEMQEDYRENTRSLPQLNDMEHKKWHLKSMEIIEKRWGVRHPGIDDLAREITHKASVNLLGGCA